MNFLTLLITIGLFQGLFLGLALIIINKGNRRANKTMGLMIITFSLSVSHVAIIKLGLIDSLSHLMMTGYPLLFVFGPLLLLYVKFLTNPKFKFDISYFYHFIPFLALIIYLLPVFYINSTAEKIMLLNTWDEWAGFLDYVISPLQSIHFLIYIYFVHREVKIHNETIKNLFSSVEGINLKWIQKIFIISLSCILFYFFLTLLGIFGMREFFKAYGGEAIALAVSLAIYLTGYFALRQPEIIILEPKCEATEPDIKPDQQLLDEEKSRIILGKLETYMEMEKPYLNNLINIKELSSQTGILSHHISFVLNKHLQLNFFDFINKYRISSACKKLSDPEYSSSTILEIAYEVGYNSKSAFNTAFKKFTNITPSDYRKSKKK